MKSMRLLFMFTKKINGKELNLKGKEPANFNSWPLNLHTSTQDTIMSPQICIEILNSREASEMLEKNQMHSQTRLKQNSSLNKNQCIILKIKTKQW